MKFTKYRLAAGLRPDPLGELKRSLAAIRGLLLRAGKGGKGRGRGKGGEGGEWKGRGVEGEGTSLVQF